MTRRRAAVVAVMAVVAAAGGCSWGPTQPEVLEDLTGVWHWLDSSGGIVGITITPASEGYELSLRFSDDREVELFRDGVTEVRTRFSYSVGPDGSSDVLLYDEALFGFPSSIVEVIAGDTLLLIDPCCDGFARRWVR